MTDRPPQVPMFGSNKEEKSRDSDNIVDILSGIAEGSPPRSIAVASTAIATGVSPAKVVALRAQYIEQCMPLSRFYLTAQLRHALSHAQIQTGLMSTMHLFTRHNYVCM